MRFAARRHQARARRPREHGAAALEFGLISPVVFAVLFGTITYGLWFNDSLNLRQGLREAARQGVVANYGSESSCGMTYQETPSANIAALMCKAEDEIGAMTGDTYVKIAVPAGWVRGEELVVCATVEADRLPGIVPLPEDRMIRSQSRMSIERVTSGQAEDGGAEVLPAGAGDWSWCA